MPRGVDCFGHIQIQRIDIASRPHKLTGQNGFQLRFHHLRRRKSLRRIEAACLQDENGHLHRCVYRGREIFLSGKTHGKSPLFIHCADMRGIRIEEGSPIIIEQFIQDDTEGVCVDACVIIFAMKHFRCHIIVGAL